MLVDGKQKLERMRDGRAVFIGRERVGDVTRHSAFRHGAETIAALYDTKADPRRRDELAYEEGGEISSLYWLRCRNAQDLARRSACHKALADLTYGLIGRSPDHVAGTLTGLAMNAALLDGLRDGCGRNLIAYWELARRNDIYLSYAVTPPSGLKSREIFAGIEREDPSLKVVAEDADGVTLSGMKMLATGAVFADEVWIGNLTPIEDKHRAESVTCAIPIATPGVSLWVREPYGRHQGREADYPLSHKFDETDSVLVCERVKVPWSRVFLHDNGSMSRRIYIETPANCYANHQSNVRFWAKMGLIVGLASRIVEANGVDKVPAVRELMGRLAALEATIGGLVAGQLQAWEQWPEGYATPNRRIMYATLNWCQEHHTEIIDIVRTLVGGVPLMMPASIDVVDDPELRDRFDRWWSTPTLDSVRRHKLYKLAWDLTGSEFAGRHQLYEKFYAGTSQIVRNQSDREAPWERFHAIVDGLIDRIED